MVVRHTSSSSVVARFGMTTLFAILPILDQVEWTVMVQEKKKEKIKLHPSRREKPVPVRCKNVKGKQAAVQRE